jgi:hypothetical protein
MNEIISCGTTDLVFDIDPKTAAFVRGRHHATITIAMDFEPMLDSGCKCSVAREVSGCYVPRIYAGAPGSDENTYCLDRKANIQIFYSPKLRSNLESNHIRIRMKRFLFLRWLELEGASSVVCALEEK